MDALASRGDEGRDKLRKATGIGTYDLIRRYPNGATQQVEDLLLEREQTQGTETSKYLEEEKTISDSQSSGERNGNSPNRCCFGNSGVVGPRYGVYIEME